MRIVFLFVFGLLSTVLRANDQKVTDALNEVFLGQLTPIQRELTSAVYKIAQEHSISPEEVHRAYRAIAFDGQEISKGGIGLIRTPVFVVVNSKQNEVIAGESETAGLI